MHRQVDIVMEGNTLLGQNGQQPQLFESLTYLSIGLYSKLIERTGRTLKEARHNGKATDNSEK